MSPYTTANGTNGENYIHLRSLISMTCVHSPQPAPMEAISQTHKEKECRWWDIKVVAPDSIYQNGTLQSACSADCTLLGLHPACEQEASSHAIRLPITRLRPYTATQTLMLCWPMSMVICSIDGCIHVLSRLATCIECYALKLHVGACSPLWPNYSRHHACFSVTTVSWSFQTACARQIHTEHGLKDGPCILWVLTICHYIWALPHIFDTCKLGCDSFCWGAWLVCQWQRQAYYWGTTSIA